MKLKNQLYNRKEAHLRALLGKSDMPLKNSLICVGVISSVHGVHGDVIIKSFTQNPSDLLDYAPLYDRNKKRVFSFKLKRVIEKGIVAHLEGVNDRDAAALLRQTELYAEREAFDDEKEDEFYFVDLEGLTIRTIEGEDIGTVKSMQDSGAGTYFEGITPDRKIFTAPFSKEAVPEIFVKKGYLVVNPDFILTAWKNEKEDV